ncbi:chromate transporter [Dethiobacter alkaliphilus]|uniref:Chromate transporter n=1 Tax=Dethiobacter alkaliphilus AHT 1 TaxID=555088 RepID=C0GCL6_DETAL|nr:chromate transporter [Dethiobacter alkaliphilus]EEG78951.1 Chromate transporter [Dethiobacter alkaliphilus AHT 1]
MIILQLYMAFLKIGMFSIGGGYVMLPLIQKEIIENYGWLTQTEFVDIIAIAEMTPGPVAINSATFIGYQTAGIWGAAFATAGVVTPSLVLMVLAAKMINRFYENRWVQAAFGGLRPAVIALIAGAAIYVAGTAITDYISVIFGLAAFALLIFTKLHPIVVLAISAVAGIIIYL